MNDDAICLSINNFQLKRNIVMFLSVLIEEFTSSKLDHNIRSPFRSHINDDEVFVRKILKVRFFI